MIHTYNLQEHVSLPGKTEQALEELSKGTIFILSSRYEGFPNVLLAMCGMRVTTRWPCSVLS